MPYFFLLRKHDLKTAPKLLHEIWDPEVPRDPGEIRNLFRVNLEALGKTLCAVSGVDSSSSVRRFIIMFQFKSKN